jgi:hypothetical protein
MSRRETDHQPLPEELTHELQGLLVEARDALNDMREGAAALARRQVASPVATSSASNNNHFGSAGLILGVIFSAICCTAMLTGGAVYAFMTSNQVAQQNAKIAELDAKLAERDRKTDDKLSRMQDYLNAIYSLAPSLKPKE